MKKQQAAIQTRRVLSSNSTYTGGSTYDSLHTVGTTPDVCAGNLRLGLHASQHVSVEKIHIYHLDGTEINYNATNADNNIHEGTILKAVIDD